MCGAVCCGVSAGVAADADADVEPVALAWPAEFAAFAFSFFLTRLARFACLDFRLCLLKAGPAAFRSFFFAPHVSSWPSIFLL